MNGLVFRPLEAWPGEPTKNRRRSQFGTVRANRVYPEWKTREQGASWSKTMEVIEREVEHLRKPGTTAVIQLDLPESQFRLDGKPYANAKPRTPAVVLNLESEWGPLRYPCDTFDSWVDNLYAIGLALEALRKVDRYGVTSRGEQYTGWRALPPGGGSTPTMTAEAAAAFLGRYYGTSGTWLLDNPDEIPDAYRVAAKVLHPDAGGSTEDFQRLQVAKAVLEKHHGT